MRRIKLLIVAFVVLLSSGCSAEYNITINKDYSVEENIISYETDSYYYMFDTPKDELVRNIINSNPAAREYSYEMYSAGDKYGASLKLKYKNIDEYKKNNDNYDILFDNLDINRENGKVEIHAYNFKKYMPFTQRKYFVEDCIVSIKLPTKAIFSNADEVDEKNHIYKWYIANSIDDVDIDIKYEENSFIKTLNSSNTILVVGIVIGIILFALLIKFIMISKKNNEI